MFLESLAGVGMHLIIHYQTPSFYAETWFPMEEAFRTPAVIQQKQNGKQGAWGTHVLPPSDEC